MSGNPKPAEHVAFLSVDRSHFLFNEETQALFALNPVAAFIWSCFDDGLDPAETAKVVTEDLEILADEARTHVQQMVEQWTEHRLLRSNDGSTSEAHKAARPSIRPELGGEPFSERPGLAFCASRTFRLLSQRFKVRFTSPEHERRVLEIFSHVLVSDTLEAAETIDIVEEASSTAIVVGRKCIDRCQSLDEVAPALKAVMTTLTVIGEPYALAFHAGAVSNESEALLLPATAGSGKSTLTAALLHSGYHYLSDDVIFLDQPYHQIRGCPFPIAIKEGGEALWDSRYPELSQKPLHLRADDVRVRYLVPPPQTWTLETADRPHRVRWMVFPKFYPTGDTALAAINSGEALTRLLPQSVAGTYLTKDDVAALARWVEGLDCYTLTMASLSSALEALHSLEGFMPGKSGPR